MSKIEDNTGQAEISTKLPIDTTAIHRSPNPTPNSNRNNPISTPAKNKPLTISKTMRQEILRTLIAMGFLYIIVLCMTLSHTFADNTASEYSSDLTLRDLGYALYPAGFNEFMIVPDIILGILCVLSIAGLLLLRRSKSLLQDRSHVSTIQLLKEQQKNGFHHRIRRILYGLIDPMFIKIRLRLLRRFVWLLGMIYSLRMFTVSSTVLPTPNKACILKKRVSGEEVVSGMFSMSIGKEAACADLMFSGHASSSVLMALFWSSEVGNNPFLLLFFWSLTFMELAAIIATRIHYTVDVILGVVITTLLYSCYRLCLYIEIERIKAINREDLMHNNNDSGNSVTHDRIRSETATEIIARCDGGVVGKVEAASLRFACRVVSFMDGLDIRQSHHYELIKQRKNEAIMEKDNESYAFSDLNSANSSGILFSERATHSENIDDTSLLPA